MSIKRISIMSFVILLFFITVFAQDVTVTKSVPEQIQYGQNLRVNISIQNNLNQEINVTVKEVVSGDEVIEPEVVIPETDPEIIAAAPPYIEWKITIQGYSHEEVYYVLKTDELGIYLFSPTVVTLDDGSQFLSNTPYTEVLCNTDGTCQVSIGENYITCPEDCSSGGEDLICNPERDSECDPDCMENEDLDCLEETSEDQETDQIDNDSEGEEQEQPEDDSESSSNQDLVAIVLFGASILILILIVLMVIFWLYKRYKRSKKKRKRKKTKGKGY